MADCVFCRIAAGTERASTVYADGMVMAFLDIEPVNPGHTLVIPKRHAAHLADMDEATGQHLFTVTMRVAQAIRQSGVRCEGVNLILSDGAAAGQDVFHVHMHIIPRFVGGNRVASLGGNRPPSTADRSELDRVAALIRDAYVRLWHDADGGG